MDNTKINLNKFGPYFNLTTSIKVFPLGYFSLNCVPRYIKINNGNAVPNAYPITAPIPPQVAADAGPNNIHAPSADATKLDVNENVPTDLFAKR